jgi:hypothetical protein
MLTERTRDDSRVGLALQKRGYRRVSRLQQQTGLHFHVALSDSTSLDAWR